MYRWADGDMYDDGECREGMYEGRVPVRQWRGPGGLSTRRVPRPATACGGLCSSSATVLPGRIAAIVTASHRGLSLGLIFGSSRELRPSRRPGRGLRTDERALVKKV